MTLDRPVPQPDHEAMDETSEWACPQPDLSMCSPDHLTPPDAPSKRSDRLYTLTALVLILLLWALGSFLDNWSL